MSNTTPSSVHGWSHSKWTGNPALGNGRSRRTPRTTAHCATITIRNPNAASNRWRRRANAASDTASATAPQTQPISTALATVVRITVGTPTVSASQRDGGKGRGTGTGTSASPSRRRSATTRARQASTPEERGDEGDVQGPLCGPVERDGGRFVGRFDEPTVRIAVDERRRAERPRGVGCGPRRVVALAEHDPAALRTRRHLDRPTGPRRRGDPDGRGGCRVGGRSGVGLGEDDLVDVESRRGAGGRRERVRAAGKRERGRPIGGAHGGIDRFAAHDRLGRCRERQADRRAVDLQHVVAALLDMIDDRWNGGGRAVEGDLGDRGRQRGGLAEPPVDGGPGFDCGDLDRRVAEIDRAGECHVRCPSGSTSTSNDPAGSEIRTCVIGLNVPTGWAIARESAVPSRAMCSDCPTGEPNGVIHDVSMSPSTADAPRALGTPVRCAVATTGSSNSSASAVASMR